MGHSAPVTVVLWDINIPRYRYISHDFVSSVSSNHCTMLHDDNNDDNIYCHETSQKIQQAQ